MSKRQIILDWIEALESGKYKQGQRTLRKDDNFCCLGVLCDVDDATRWASPPNNRGWGYWWNSCFNSFDHNTLSHFGLHRDEMIRLIDMNDEGKSFPEIAAYIRENILPRYQQEIPA